MHAWARTHVHTHMCTHTHTHKAIEAGETSTLEQAIQAMKEAEHGSPKALKETFSAQNLFEVSSTLSFESGTVYQLITGHTTLFACAQHFNKIKVAYCHKSA